MNRDNRILVLSGIVVLLGAFGWRTMNDTSYSERAAATLAVPSSPGTLDARPTIAVVFSVRDCGTLVESLRFWNEPHRRDQVRVLGWVYGLEPDQSALEKVIRGAGLQFPVEVVEAGSLDGIRRTLGYEGESFVVVLDRHGQVRLASPLSASTSPAGRVHVRDFAERL